MRDEKFEMRKMNALSRLASCGADADIADILERINRLDGFFTTSSCSGRIVLLKIPYIGAKRDAKFLAKWHRPVTADEVLRVLSSQNASAFSKASSEASTASAESAKSVESAESVKSGKSEVVGKRHEKASDGGDEVSDTGDAGEMNAGEVWLLAQPPIIHVVCRDLEKAREMLSVAYNSGFKYSSVKSLAPEGIVVEILSTERMDVPIGRDGFILCPPPYISFVVSKANMLLKRGKAKLARLRENLENLNNLNVLKRKEV